MLMCFGLLVSGCSQENRILIASPGLADRMLDLGSVKEFSLRYIHSVHLTPVYENFVIQTDGTFLLISTRYQSYGVGLPSLPEEGTLRLQDGWMILENLQRPFSEIRLRVGPEAKLSLLVAGKTYPLHEWFSPGSLLVIRKGL